MSAYKINKLDDDFFIAEIKFYFRYDKDTGLLYWRRSKRGIKRNSPVGSFNNKGYLKATLHTRGLLVHRIIWVLVYGKFPEQEIDHINGNKTDNRIENLRDVSGLINVRSFREKEITCLT